LNFCQARQLLQHHFSASSQLSGPNPGSIARQAQTAKNILSKSVVKESKAVSIVKIDL
jgi:hypothetical protein